jgi:DNA-binding MarR family transcriptional regulator
MSATTGFDRAAALEVRDECLCFAAQRAARELARRFDRALGPLNLTNNQYSMMVAMGVMGRPRLGELSRFLAVDHATMTAAVRKLEKRGLVTQGSDARDRRARCVALTAAGEALVARAMVIWRDEHAKLAAEHGREEAREIRRQILRLAPPVRKMPAAA